MGEEIIRIKSVSDVHAATSSGNVRHPLITILEASACSYPKGLTKQKIVSDLYTIMLKDKDCGIQYGRNSYDFDEGVLTFIGPDQVVSFNESPEEPRGWMLFFHPDLIRSSHLGKHIRDYRFFSYDVHEALHLSEKEEGILNDCVEKIEMELDQNIDRHSQSLLISNLELLLNYCQRFYERQFHTRKEAHSDVVSKVEQLIRTYFEEGKQLEHGTITVQDLAEGVHLSSNYLSDLLKKETGRNAKEHINYFVIDQAKTNLLNSRANVSEIAYELGFNYPHYFSRMFKKETGMTPQEYREKRLN
ncbi:MAG: AraC family transcriptional regulator [Bacteroidetes bacterium]|nr:MAG: AraC family transcriptional regulator [Bacteroidota bacterium]